MFSPYTCYLLIDMTRFKVSTLLFHICSFCLCFLFSSFIFWVKQIAYCSILTPLLTLHLHHFTFLSCRDDNMDSNLQLIPIYHFTYNVTNLYWHNHIFSPIYPSYYYCHILYVYISYISTFIYICIFTVLSVQLILNNLR